MTAQTHFTKSFSQTFVSHHAILGVASLPVTSAGFFSGESWEVLVSPCPPPPPSLFLSFSRRRSNRPIRARLLRVGAWSPQRRAIPVADEISFMKRICWFLPARSCLFRCCCSYSALILEGLCTDRPSWCSRSEVNKDRKYIWNVQQQRKINVS